MKVSVLCLLTFTLCALSACDRLGLPDPAKDAAAKEAEGRAIGSACRQAGRALEDCFNLNQAAQKAAIFAGWKEMNDYMTENKLEVIKPEIPQQSAKSSATSSDSDADSSAEADSSKPAKSSSRRRSKADSGT
jgi:hypothetical protein